MYGRMETSIDSFEIAASSRRFSVDNFTKVIVDFLLTYGGLSKSNLASKLVCFRANGVTTFQGSKTGVSM